MCLCIFGFSGVGDGKGRVVAEEGKEETTEHFFKNPAASRDTFPYKGCNSFLHPQVHHLHFRLWQPTSTSIVGCCSIASL